MNEITEIQVEQFFDTFKEEYSKMAKTEKLQMGYSSTAFRIWNYFGHPEKNNIIVKIEDLPSCFQITMCVDAMERIIGTTLITSDMDLYSFIMVYFVEYKLSS